MAKVKIEIFEGGSLSATISVPVWLMTGAAGMLPKAAAQRLQQHVDLDQIARALKDPSARGQLIEIEDHAGGDRIVISVAGEG